MRLNCLFFLLAIRLAVAGAMLSFLSTEVSAQMPSYADDFSLLKKHTEVIELKPSTGAGLVAVTPAWQGRVMTSTFEAPGGASLGWVNRKFIEKREPDRVFNNYGGAERFWLSPEAGNFGLYFAPGQKQVVENWFTPEGLNEGPFEVVEKSPDRVRLERRVQVGNYAGTSLDFDVSREISATTIADFKQALGDKAELILKQTQARLVGFKTDNRVTNRGEKLSRKKGLASIWTLGQFRPGRQVAIVLPHRPASAAEQRELITTRYFGDLPATRLARLDRAALFRGDGKFRSKIGVAPAFALPIAAAVDLDAMVLTLVHFSLPDEPTKQTYLNNLWDLPQKDPYAGDVVNSYNDLAKEGEDPFYELETLSSAKELATGESIRHVSATFHVRGGADTIARMTQEVLGVPFDRLREFLEQPVE